jgi:hypothetical protein
MKKRLLALLLIFPVLFIGCTKKKDDNQTEQLTDSNANQLISGIPDYERLQESSRPFTIGVIFDENIDWLSFSKSDYKKEEKIILDYEFEEGGWFSAYERSDKNISADICERDLNGDEKNEVIGFLRGYASVLGGNYSHGMLRVYEIDDGKITRHHEVFQYLIDPDFSNSIGIIDRVDGYADFICANRILIWDGERWSL